MAFDSLSYSSHLQKAGVPRQHAEAHAELARDMIIVDLVTKGDLVSATKDIQAVIVKLEADLRNEMKLLEQRIIIRLGAMIVAAVGILAIIQKLF